MMHEAGLSLMCALAAYTMNAAWEIPLLAGAGWVGSRWVRRCGPGDEHRLWVGVLVWGIAMPVLPMFNSLLLAPLVRGGDAGGAAVAGGAGTGSRVIGAGLGPLGLPEWAIVGLCALCLGSLAYRAGLLGWRLVRTAMLVRESRPMALAPERAAWWERAQGEFSVRNVALRCSARVRGIAATGWRQPVILVAPDFLEHSSEEDFLSAMGHELAHLERRDPVKNLFYEALGLVAAFHPVSWRVRAQMAQTREMVCDAMAVERLVEAKAYRRSLLRLADRMTAMRGGPTPALGMFEGNGLEKRIMRMRGKKTKLSGVVREVLVMASMLILGLASVSGAFAKAVVNDQDARYGRIYHPGPEITNPKLVYAPNPEYSAEARRAKYQGVCVVGLIVDAQGNPQRVHVVRPLGMGLDQKALEAVRQYRFEPALHHGKPVAAAIKIEVNFKIY